MQGGPLITAFPPQKWEGTPHLFIGKDLQVNSQNFLQFSVTWSSIKDIKVNFKRYNALS